MDQVTLTVLFKHGNVGVAAWLRLSKIEPGIGVIYPDPASMSFVAYDPVFADAIQIAWELSAPLHRSKCDVVWRLEVRPDGPLGTPTTLSMLEDRSLGLAFRVGLRHLLDPQLTDLLPNPDAAIIGAIEIDPQQPGGRIASVGGYQEKLKAAVDWKLKQVLLPVDDRERPDVVKFASSIPDLVGVRTVGETSENISGLMGDLLLYLDG